MTSIMRLLRGDWQGNSEGAFRFRPRLGFHGKQIVNRAAWRHANLSHMISTIVRLPRLAGIGLIRLYRLVLSPWIGSQCRYLPTCSEYTEAAIRAYGLWAGAWIGLARFQRCGPMGASGHDPIPETLPENAAWYLPWRYGRWTGRHIDPATRLDHRH